MPAIGSSDAPALAGVDPHGRTPWRLWAELTGLLPRSQDDAPWLRWGRRIEALVRETVAEEMAAQSVHEAYPLCHATREWQRATPDGLLYLDRGEPWLCEVKAIRGPLPDEPLLAWLAQCQWQLSVWEGFRGVALGVYGELDCRVWRVAPHAGLQRKLVGLGKEMMRRVEAKEAPPVEAPDNQWLAKAYPTCETLKTVPLGAEALEWDRARTEAIVAGKEAKTKRDLAEAQIKSAMGAAHTAVLTDGTVYTWPTSKRAGYTVEETTVRTLRRKGERI